MATDVTITITKRGSGYGTNDTGLYIKGSRFGGTDVTFDADELFIAENCAQTGDDYLILTDSDASDPGSYLYSREVDVWGNKFMDAGDSSNYKPTFYSVDGALRASDGNFGGSNNNQWYGYIDNTFFKTSEKTYNTDRWISESQAIKKPEVGEFVTAVTAVTLTAAETLTSNWGSGTIITRFIHENNLNNTLTTDNVIKVSISLTATTADALAGWESGDTQTPNVNFSGTLRAGYGNNSDFADQHGNGPTNPPTVIGNNTSKYINFDILGWNSEVTHTFDLTFPASGTGMIDISGISSNYGVLAFLDNLKKYGNSSDSANIRISKIVYSSGTWNTAAHPNLVDENVILEVESKDNSDAELWDNNGWNFGVSFVYDGIQESIVKQLPNATDSTGYINIAANKSPNIKVTWKYSKYWNKRITGINVYVRKSGKKITDKSWYRQAEVDFVSSKCKMTHSGEESDIGYLIEIDEHYALISEDRTSGPNLIDSFEIRNGYLDDVEYTDAKYKTAVVANRKAYIANLQVRKKDGTKENMADAMLKSPPNQFDIFPASNIIEASIRDGDVIVKLEEYADRILQFKKDKMHIINVSQNIEFMEGTYQFKGVQHPAAVCKTDYGIAWVNDYGCFLYNGREVVNLIERGAIRIIKESEWQSFITNDSIVGYLPKKRQLIILKTCAASGDGDVFIFDMITKGWVRGNSKFADSSVKTNFVNDWNGDLILAHGASGSVVKWGDDSYASTSFSYVTPDIDFGQPAQRKRIYKVYVTYKSGSTNVPTFTYGIDGDTSLSTAVASGVFETGKSDWSKAEFKLGADANNCYSIRFKINGSVDAQFEINDMSVVFRGKPVK